ncbi:HEXXH motif-containing protein [Catenuloplanes nepalensis]|uniref:HEXXH motif-containing protein n=1 Tax=Catenuloplanes nepalensis TaxID=587533 RepID=A0ABT9N249_9ACTN|nr:HEXXH motif domain-containing protein [Catenuloplanes nepalensis]MDP9797346.1 HEXXH motif-containing protein [Catenuloplanes nepalensis]
MTDFHRLSDDDFAALATGLGGAGAVRRLAESQLSRTLLLLRYVCTHWPGPAEHRDEAVAALAAAQKRKPEVYERLLGSPLTGAWAAGAVRRLRSGEVASADLGYLGALAAAAAAETGLDAGTWGYATGGAITLPGLGTARLPGGTSDGPVRITVTGGAVTLACAGRLLRVPGEASSWEPRRALGAGVVLEDGDPYRDSYHAPPAGRLAENEAAGWSSVFAEAWDLLGRVLPERAPELAAGLRVLVPLHDDGTGAARSGTGRDSFGMVGLTRPLSAVDLVVTLVHEFQHSKLSAVLALCPMYEPSGAERHFAPWRTDPRPTGGLLQGVYAFLGVADAWSRLRGHDPEAEAQFAAMRAEVRAGWAGLDGSAELTPAGRRFVTAMGAAIDELDARPLPAVITQRSREELVRKHEAWSVRNGRS